MSSLRPSRSVNVWGAALGLGLAAIALVVPAPMASAATTQSGTVTVAVAAKDPATASLRKAKVSVSAVRPASVKRSRWTMPVSGTPALDAASVELSGRLKFARGKRNVTFTSLRLSLGKKPAISGTVGKRRVTVLTLSGAPKRDAGARTINLKNATASLSPAAVRTLRSDLSSSHVKAGRLGKLTVSVRVAATPVTPGTPTPVVPVPQPEAPAPPLPIDPGGLPPDPGPIDPEPVDPGPPCWAATPAGSTDWIACDPMTGGRLRTWIDYIGTGGTVQISAGATRLSTYDARLSPGTWQSASGGRATNAHTGQLNYSYPSHGNLDVQIENLKFDVAADRSSADVFLDATYNSFASPGGPPVVDTGVKAMTVDLTAARSRANADGKTTFELAPAFLTAAGSTIWSNFYDVGAAFGAFTITVPDSVG